MSRPLPIAFVITELDVGGAERCLVNIATRLDRAKFAPRVFAISPPPRDDALIGQLRAAEVPVECLGFRSARRVFKAIRRLRQRLSQQAPMLVQSFMFHANVVAAAAAHGLHPRPVILGGLRVADPSGWRAWLERRAARRMERVVCVSRAVSDFAARRLRLPVEKRVVIPNGVDVGRFDAQQAPASEHLVFVGRLHEQKGLDWFLPLLAKVLDDHPTHPGLRIVGDGPQKPALVDLARQCGVLDRVEFLGWRNDADELISASALLLLPSRWEGMPNVVLEAMAAGRPVLASRAEGVVELLGDDHAAQTFDFGDAERASRMLRQWLGDDQRRTDLGRQNRQRVERHFSLDRVVAEYAELFERCVSESGRWPS